MVVRGKTADRIRTVNNLVKRIADRYRYAWTVLRGLVKTDFKLRYQGSFLGVAWSVLKPLMLFCVMYIVLEKAVPGERTGRGDWIYSLLYRRCA